MINLSALKANIDHEIEASKKESNSTFRCTMGLAELISEALEQTLSTDVAEVVRCKDCKNCHKYTKWNGTEYFGCIIMCDVVEVDANHYCSYGERKDEDE